MKRTSITLPEELVNEAKKYSEIASINFSAFVAMALREYLRNTKIEKATKSFGEWTNREQESTDIVVELRKDRTVKTGLMNNDYGHNSD